MVIKDEKNKTAVVENEREKKEFILATIWNFHEQGREEVSISELQESISQYQKSANINIYEYSDKFLLSADLLSDLKELNYQGYLKDYHFRLDGLFPKRFFALTSIGRGIGKNASKNLTGDLSSYLNSAVNKAIENYHKRWRLWGR